MKRKQLPKAIMRSDDELRAIAAHAAADEEAPASQPASPTGAFATEATAFARPVANDQFPVVSIYVDRHAARRRALARRIVERHKTYAAIGGLSPLPILNVAGVTAIIMRMVKQLSGLYEVPFERDRTRSLIVSLIGGAVPTGLGTATASTLAFVLPGRAGRSRRFRDRRRRLTHGIGLVFLDRFEARRCRSVLPRSSTAEPIDVAARRRQGISYTVVSSPMPRSAACCIVGCRPDFSRIFAAFGSSTTGLVTMIARDEASPCTRAAMFTVWPK
jgi:hypothetical protein